MASIPKRVAKAREGIDRTKLYPLDEAVKLVKERAKAKFDETVEIAMNLGVDPARRPDGARRLQPAERLGPHRARRRVRARRQG
jgi:ribosomal protein L1